MKTPFSGPEASGRQATSLCYLSLNGSDC